MGGGGGGGKAKGTILLISLQFFGKIGGEGGGANAPQSPAVPVLINTI